MYRKDDQTLEKEFIDIENVQTDIKKLQNRPGA